MLRAPTLPPLIRRCHFRFICTICDSLLTAGVSRWSASSLRTQAGSVLLTGMCPVSSAVSPHGRCLRSNWRRGETSPTIGGETSAGRAGHGGVRAGSAVPAGDTDSFSPSVTMRGPPVLSLGQATETGQGQCQPSRSFPTCRGPPCRGPPCRGRRGEGVQSQGGQVWRDKAVCPQACFLSPELQEDGIAQPPCSAMGSCDQWTVGESRGQRFQEVPRNLPTILRRPAEPRAGSVSVLCKGQRASILSSLGQSPL